MPSLNSAAAAVTLAMLIVTFRYSVYGDEHQESCSRWCGVHNIRSPFRLKDSPKKCGDKRYILSCEDNNQLILYYEFGKNHGKFYVQSINYNNYTIRLLDVNFGYSNFTLPPHSLGLYNFTYTYSISLPYEMYVYNILLAKPVLYMRCPNHVQYSSGIYFASPACMNISTYEQPGNSFYVNYIGENETFSDSGLADGCGIVLMYLTSLDIQNNNNHNKNNNISCTDIRREIFYGFELSWLNSFCKDGWYADLDDNNTYVCVEDLHLNFGEYSALQKVAWNLVYISILIALLVGFKFVLGAPCIIALLIYKWRRKHFSMYDGVEDFLRSDNNIMPIRYSYKDIKKITHQFKTKLGNGGYGSVFKGQLQSGRLVAVKLLDKAKSNGQDFINEVVTIGRIHHVNVAHLIGFCVEGSKRVLIYEFMPNGSLEKYIFSHTKENYSLSCEQLYSISLGVARGIEYLHNGCNMKILHFDIKPHNILLDENFNPKVSDFGLARLSPTDKSIVSLTAARGTIGYMAPELFYRNVGTISHKADVYSFGMLLMEMASRRKNLNALADQSSEIYFPFWIYDRLHDGREVTIENDTDQEMKLAKKMMIVALWCIQTKPEDRPSMEKVLEMLEEEDGDLQIPNKPYFCPQDPPTADVGDDNCSNSWTSYGTSVSYPKGPT
ncbi:putative glycerophosphodiester phosphodiesterase, protein kinase RLK-Pelle-LRK10L-2 family [Medicago truncatula]|uniref:Putative glycerophosphodiester phosphodiesterase, protein kinase RLK-Pelle-LRK10L-2 family n=1 Tax=Medicago truncatula TaxID=3880 RepID=G7I957_MEDTR|nr:LEAF RUST 10 DISEASE-RESISTANCE LOCUS RECEPTOR-LIKE PROTEIN KINASE-like 2.2 [Medicago truncatula]AES59877.1 receptor-like kinase [Medicago truncatula]RHN77978.1 putative glycerophosphodiester phosphodiesterase, protein kinase RLK-Pelle-LRK10L-2 family [Medicago truncatula]